MDHIKEIVEGILEIYKTRDVYELLHLLDVKLIRKKFISNIRGKFIRNKFLDEFIFISEDLTYEEEKVVISHELGHLILHTELMTSYYTENNLLIKNRFEIEANIFSAELLIEDNLEINDGTTVTELSQLLGVPEELVKIKYRLI